MPVSSETFGGLKSEVKLLLSVCTLSMRKVLRLIVRSDSLGPLIGPAIGPVCGAWIAEKLPNNGYVWVFYSTSIFCAFVQLAGLIWLRETYAPIILFRKAKAMKKERGLPADSDHIKTVFEVKQGTKTHAHIVTHGLVRPFVLFVHEPILQVRFATSSRIASFTYRHI